MKEAREARGYRGREKRERIPSRGTASKNALSWDIKYLVQEMTRRSASLDLRVSEGGRYNKTRKMGRAGRVLFLTV